MFYLPYTVHIPHQLPKINCLFHCFRTHNSYYSVEQHAARLQIRSAVSVHRILWKALGNMPCSYKPRTSQAKIYICLSVCSSLLMEMKNKQKNYYQSDSFLEA